jgi:hypothetical protein
MHGVGKNPFGLCITSMYILGWVLAKGLAVKFRIPYMVGSGRFPPT